MQEPVQQATSDFFVPVASVYLLACVALLVATWRWPQLWMPRKPLETDRKWLDLGLVLGAAAGILILGQLYRSGFLLPLGVDGATGLIYQSLNQAIIFSPIFLVLLLRWQAPETVFVSSEGLYKKCLWGVGLGLAGVVSFLVMRGELSGFRPIMAHAADADNLTKYALPIFLEVAALGFAFVRIRWALGLPAALVLPAVLFALAHVPGSIESGTAWPEIAAFFVFNAVLVVAMLYIIQRLQDVIWIWPLHYLMDAAIKAY